MTGRYVTRAAAVPAEQDQRRREFEAERKTADNLKDLADKINVCFQKSDDYRLTAALHLAQAKEACKKAGKPFKRWVEQNIKWKYGEATRLAKIGEADDPKAALADLRKKGAAREAKRNARAKVASSDATPADFRQAYIDWLVKQPKEVRKDEYYRLGKDLGLTTGDFVFTIRRLPRGEVKAI